MENLKTAISIIFKRKGKDNLRANEIVLAASMDHRWFTHSDAKRFVRIAKELKLISKQGEGYTPNFDYRSVEPTLDFKAGKEMLEKLEKKKKGSFQRILDDAAEKFGISQREFTQRAEEKKERTGIDIEVASLVVLSEMGKDISEYLPDVEKEIMVKCCSKK